MTRRARKRVVGLVVVALAVALFGGTSLAYFTAVGKGSAASTVTSLKHPAITTAIPAIGGTVSLAWGAVTSPDSNPVTYSVKRDGEAAEGTCAPPESPTSSLSCVDKGVGPGPHLYVVTAHWRTWEADSEPKLVSVTIGAATHLDLVAVTTSPLAGAADNLTITAEDSAGTPVPTYTGAKSLTFSGASPSPGGTAPTVSNSSGTAVAFGTATAITFASGVAIVNTITRNGVMRIYRSGVSEVAVSDGTLSTAAPLSLTVSELALLKITLTAASTTPAVGEADDLTISTQDTYGNPIATYDGPKSVTFVGGTTSPGGKAATVTDENGEPVAFGTATSIRFEAGVATVGGSANGEMRLYKPGLQSITVGNGLLTSAAVKVTPVLGALAGFGVTASTTTPAAGASVNLTTTAQDAYGNTVTSYTGAKSLIFSGAESSPSGKEPTVVNSGGSTISFGEPTTITFTNGVAVVGSNKNGQMKLYRGGPTSIAVTDGTISTLSPLAVTVSTTLTKFILEVQSKTPHTGEADGLTVSAQDVYANVVAGYDGSKKLTFSGGTTSPNSTVPTVTDSSGKAVAFATATTIVFDEGVASVDGSANGVMRLYKVGAQSIKATEGSITSATVSVNPEAAPEKFILAASTSSFTVATSVNLTTTAQDLYGNTAVEYVGPHELTFSGASASPVGTVPTVSDNGGSSVPFGEPTEIKFTKGIATISTTKNGVMKLYAAGATQLTVSDGTIATATTTNVTVNPTTATRLAFLELTSSTAEFAPGCLFTCTITELGKSGKVRGDVAVTDLYGNVVSSVGTGHSAAVTVTGGGTVTSGTITFPKTGRAESPEEFLYTAPSSGSYTAALKVATTAGTTYTSATATATK